MENEHKSNKKTVFSALIWKLMERFGVQGTQFVLQLVLARLLDPEHYGVLSLMIIFTTLANGLFLRVLGHHGYCGGCLRNSLCVCAADLPAL